jgi:hypothetical protein
MPESRLTPKSRVTPKSLLTLRSRLMQQCGRTVHTLNLQLRLAKTARG